LKKKSEQSTSNNEGNSNIINIQGENGQSLSPGGKSSSANLREKRTKDLALTHPGGERRRRSRGHGFLPPSEKRGEIPVLLIRDEREKPPLYFLRKKENWTSLHENNNGQEEKSVTDIICTSKKKKGPRGCPQKEGGVLSPVEKENYYLD